jgi:hypothetical protein
VAKILMIVKKFNYYKGLLTHTPKKKKKKEKKTIIKDLTTKITSNTSYLFFPIK